MKRYLVQAWGCGKESRHACEQCGAVVVWRALMPQPQRRRMVCRPCGTGQRAEK